MEDSNSPDDQRTGRNRWLAATIMLLPLVVVVAATSLWWAVQQGHIDLVAMLGTHNKGHLISPVEDFRATQLVYPDGREYQFDDQEPKWTLVMIGDANCDQSCRETLWLGRQLHTALGRRALYLRRLYISGQWPLNDELAEFLAREHPKLTALGADESTLEQLRSIPAADGVRAMFYLVDKRGNLMMYYTPENSGKDVIADLKFLMKQTGDD